MLGPVVLTVPCCDPLGPLLERGEGGIELGDAAGDPKVRDRGGIKPSPISSTGDMKDIE